MDLEYSNMHVEIFEEDSLDDFMLTGLEFEHTEHPVLGLVIDPEPGFMSVTFDYEVPPADPDHVAALNPHAVGRIGDDPGSLDDRPARQFPDALLKLCLFVHRPLSVTETAGWTSRTIPMTLQYQVSRSSRCCFDLAVPIMKLTGSLFNYKVFLDPVGRTTGKP